MQFLVKVPTVYFGTELKLPRELLGKSTKSTSW